MDKENIDFKKITRIGLPVLAFAAGMTAMWAINEYWNKDDQNAEVDKSKKAVSYTHLTLPTTSRV